MIIDMQRENGEENSGENEGENGGSGVRPGT